MKTLTTHYLGLNLTLGTVVNLDKQLNVGKGTRDEGDPLPNF